VQILHVITTIERGGAENQLLVLVRQQIINKHKVSVYYLKGDNELEESFRSLGAVVIGGPNHYGLLSHLRNLRTLTRDPALIVHAHLPRAEIFSALVKPAGGLVITRHNAEPFFPGAPRLLSVILSRLVLHRASCILAITSAVSNYMRSSREISTRRKIYVVHYGYPENECVPVKRSSSGIIGTMSRLTSQKDIPTLLRAFAIVLHWKSELILEIFGEGPERVNLEGLAKSLKISESVKFMGRTQFVDKSMQSFDLFLLTSRYEGFGLVLLEAMSNRVPIITSNSEAAIEVMGENYPLIFPVGDYVKLAELIIQELGGTNSFILNYLENRLQEFSPMKMESEIFRIYSEVLESTISKN